MTRLAWLALMVWSSSALAFNPFEKNDPLIADGTSLFEKGQFEDALKKFDEAAAQHPQDPRGPYNRGLALHKLGRNDEAKTALQNALEIDRDHSLGAKTHYNLGNVAAAAGDKKAAMREYREAMRADPADELARHNYEVLLKDLPPQQNGSDAGTPDGGKSDAGRPDAGPDGGARDAGADGGTDGGKPDGGSPDGGGGDGGSDGGSDGGADGGNKGDGGQGDGGRGDGGKGDDDKKGDAGENAPSPQRSDSGVDGGEAADAGESEQQTPLLPDGGLDVSKQEAEKLLDTMKNTEKNMQLWRFRQPSKGKPHGKDW
jgi:tetratricopeptide (TPR) repeat protein